MTTTEIMTGIALALATDEMVLLSSLPVGARFLRCVAVAHGVYTVLQAATADTDPFVRHARGVRLYLEPWENVYRLDFTTTTEG